MLFLLFKVYIKYFLNVKNFNNKVWKINNVRGNRNNDIIGLCKLV